MWLNFGGYKNIEKLTNCNEVRSKIQLSNTTEKYWYLHWRNCIDYHMKQMCGGDMGFSSMVPHSHICDDGLEYFSPNYKLCTKGANMDHDSCTVISIGSNNIWQFEEQVHARSKCEIHTFDPREYEKRGGHFSKKIQVPSFISDRTYLHRLALGPKPKPEYKVITYTDVLQLSNVTNGKKITNLITLNNQIH